MTDRLADERTKKELVKCTAARKREKGRKRKVRERERRGEREKRERERERERPCMMLVPWWPQDQYHTGCSKVTYWIIKRGEKL
jgi:hypothetical protein